MVCDFSFLKILLLEIDRIFDHSFIMWCDDAAMKMASGINEKEIDRSKLGLLGYQEMVTLFGKVAVVPTVPTAENLAAIWLNICRNYLDDSAEYKHLKDTFGLTRMKVWETPNSCVEVS
jgi:6-pyruvoyl-tetrahydropterin synthase